nr:cellulase family glycosylhydrolase [Candidatus Sigynarchaeota archaeon]
MRPGIYRDLILLLATLFVVLPVPTASALENPVMLHLDSSPRQHLLSVNDSVFGATGLSLMHEFNLQLGMSWRRKDFTWQDIEPSNGTFDWSSYGVDGVETAGIYHIILLVYGNENIEGGESNFVPRSQLDEWAGFVEEVVSRFKGNKSTIAYEVWNEPNLEGFWTGTTEDYARLLATSAEVIRRVDPDALVLAGGTASSPESERGPTEVFYEQLFQMNESHPELRGKIVFDIYNMHAYFNTASEYREAIRTQKQVCERHGFEWEPHPDSARFQDQFSRIWCTEAGWNNIQHGIKSSTIACFEGIGRHLIFGGGEFKLPPECDALRAVIPLWRNCTPFQHCNPSDNCPLSSGTFTLYAARTEDGRVAIAYWNEQRPGATFSIEMGCSVLGASRLSLPNFSWSYTDLDSIGGLMGTTTRIRDIVVEEDFHMLVIDPVTDVDAITIIVNETIDSVIIIYIIPCVAFAATLIVGYNFSRSIRSRSKDGKPNGEGSGLANTHR